MNLNEIKQYPHKVKKVLINNENLYSINDYITIKISLTDVKDDEIVRFSLKENDDFIHHQSLDDDYFIRMPNNLNDITVLYAHYFIYDLYEYEESEEVYSIYPFEDLFNDNPVNSQGTPYKIQIQSDGYDMQLGNDGKPYIRSLLPNSVDNYKNPNYKNYYNTNIDDKKDMTIQGMFPLSSRYRPPYKYLNAPNITDNALWQASDNTTNCEDRQKAKPYWEAKIHRIGLSPLIADQIDGEYSPINVFLNYNYLPTTTEYHQHYFGFEGKHYQNNNTNKPHLTLNSDLNVFEGTGINTINNFGNDNNYRIINIGNPFDDTYSMFVDHENIIQLNLNNTINHNCRLEYNKCDKYWTYTPLGEEGKASLTVKLDYEHLYTLKYYIYIPQEAECEADSCYIQVNEEKIHNEFLKQDKILRNQWIYHEVPFISQGEDRIDIIGPQHDDSSHTIHFIYLTIEEFQEYTPTIKYSASGLHISEKNKSVIRSTKGDDNCVELPTPKENNIQPKKLPNPNGKVLFSLDSDIDIYYDNFTSDMYYYRPSTYTNIIKLENNLLSWGNDENLSLEYLYENIPSLESNDKTSLVAEYGNKITFVQGVNNSFILHVTDTYNNIVSSGEVECVILNDKEQTPNTEEIVKNIGKKPINADGTVLFDKIDLRHIEIEGDYAKYYLRIKYINPCDNQATYDYKPFYIEPQRIHLTPFVNDSCVNHQSQFILQPKQDGGFEKFGYSTPNGFVIYYPEDELPLKVSVFVQNQNGTLMNDCTIDGDTIDIGYCELSIDDELKQVSIVDTNGESDFYLDLEDLTKLSQVIKIEYYNKYYEPIEYIYFDIVFDEQTKLKPIIPINILLFDENGLTYVNNNTIEVDKDECVLMDIDTAQHKKFRLEIYEHNNATFNQNNAQQLFAQNFAQISEQELFYIVGLLNDSNIDSPTDVIPKASMQATTKYYTFKTTNMTNNNGIVIDDLWRDYQRTIRIDFKN